MANKNGNGVIIDVGFNANWQEILKEIEAEFGKIDFSKSLDLEDAIRKQIKSIRDMLQDLNGDIDNLFKSKNSTIVLDNLVSQVALTSDGLKELTKSLKAMGADTSGVERVTKSLAQQGKVIADTSEAVKEISKVSKGNVTLIDTSKTKEDIKELISTLQSIKDFDFDFSDNNFDSLTTESAKVNRLKELYKEYSKEKNIAFSKEISSENIIDVSNSIVSIQKLSEEITQLYDSLTLSASKGKYNNYIESIFSDVDQIEPQIDRLIPKLKELIATTNTTNKEGRKLTVPLELEDGKKTSGTKLLGEVQDVIRGINEKIKNDPIEVEVKMMSAYQSRGNKTLLEDIKRELGNIKDGEVSEKLDGLIDKMNKRTANALLLNVELGTEKAHTDLVKFIEQAKSDLLELKQAIPLANEINVPKLAADVVTSYSELADSLGDAIANMEKLTKELPKIIRSVTNARKKISEYVEATSRLFLMFADKLAEVKSSLSDSVNIDVHITNDDDTFEKLKQLQDVLSKLSATSNSFKNISISSNSIGSVTFLADLLKECDTNLKRLGRELTKFDNQIQNTRSRISNYVSATSRLFLMFNEKLTEAKETMDGSFDLKLKLDPDTDGFATDIVNKLENVKIPVSIYFADLDLKKSADVLKIPMQTFTKNLKDEDKEFRKQQEKQKREEQKERAYTRASNLMSEKGSELQALASDAINDKYKVLGQTLEATAQGFVKITTYAKDADGAYTQFEHHAKSAKKVTLASESNADSAMKHGRNLERLIKLQEELINQQSILEKNGGWIGELTPENTEGWDRLVDLAGRFDIKMQDVSKIVRTVDKELNESFQFFTKDGELRTTLGMDSDNILYVSEQLADKKKDIDGFAKSIEKVKSAYKGALKGDDVAVGKFTDALQNTFDLYNKIHTTDLNLLSDEDIARVEEVKQRLQSLFAEMFNEGNLREQFEKNGNMEEYIQSIIPIAQELGSVLSSVFSSNMVADSNALSESVKKFGKALSESKDDANKLAKDTKIVNMIKTIRTELNKNSAMLPQYKAQYKQLLDQLEAGFSGAEKISKDAIQGILIQLMRLQGEVQASGKVGLNFINRFKKAVSTNLVQYVARFFSIQDIVRYVRTISSSIVDLDTALIDLKKTTTMTTDELEQFYYASNDIAKQMGVTTKQIIEQAAVWSRLGYSTKEASEQMAALSSQFKVISPGMSLENATDGLVSTMQAFHIGVEDAEREIMDSINRVGNTMATSNDEIVEMLKRSSAAMYEANNTLAETIALESAAVQVTRNAQTTGTAFRTISMRIRGYNEETEEYVGGIEELTGKIADLTKTAKTPGGLSLFTDATKTEYKSTYQLLKDISEIYSDLTDKQQASLLEALAGKRGGQVLAGILSPEGFKQVEKAMGEIEKSAGSADAELEIVKESVEYKINALRETWIGFFQELLTRQDIGELIDSATEASENFKDVIDSLVPIVKEFLDLIGGLAKGIGKIADITGKATVPLLGLLGVGINKSKNKDEQGIIGKILNSGSLNKISTELTELTKVVGALSDEADEINVVDDALIGFNSTLENTATKSARDFIGAEGIIVKSLGKIKQKAYETATVFDIFYKGSGGGAEGLLAGLGAIVNPAVLIGIATAAAGVAAAYVIWKNKTEQVLKASRELTEKNKELLKTAQDEAKGYKESADELSDLYEQYKSAKKGSEEYYEITNKIAELSPSLVTGYNNEGDAISVNTALIEEQIKAYQDLADEKQKYAQNQATQNAADDASEYANISKRLDDANNRVKKYQEALNSKAWLNEESEFYYSSEEEIAKLLKNAVNDAREYSLRLAEIRADVADNWLGMLDPISDDLTDSEKEIENNIRGLVVSIASIEENDFQEIYDKLHSVGSNFWRELLTLEQGDLSNAEYKKQAQTIYNQIIQALVASGMELTDEQKLALTVELKLKSGVSDEAKALADKVLINKGDRFGKGNSVDAVTKWYDNLSKADRELIEDNKEFVQEAQQMARATGDYNKALDDTLAKMKEITKERSEFDVGSFETNDNELESLQKLYQQFKDNVEGDKIKVPLDISDVQGLSDEWKNLEEFKEFQIKVTTDGLSVDEVQRAFDDLATAYARNMIKIEGATAETMASIKSQMKLDGFEEESVNKFVDAVVAEDKMQELVQTFNEAKESEEGLTDSAYENAKAMFEEAEQIGIAKDMLIDYLRQAIAAGFIKLDGDTSWLDTLCEKLGIAIGDMKELLALSNQQYYAENDRGYSSSYNKAYYEQREKSNKLKEENDNKYKNLINTYTPKNTSGASSAGKEAGDAYVDAYTKELESLEKQKEAGLITEKQYLDRMRALYQRYFGGLSKYQEKYNEEQQKYLQGMLSLYNSAISAVGSIIDRRIKGLNKERDAIIKGYEAQKDAIQDLIDEKQEQIDGIQDEIDAIQKEIDAINEANEARQRQLTLQEDLYNMERLMAQRTRLTYKNGEMVYTNDTRELRDAREKVYQDQIQEEIAAKEKQIQQKQEEIELIEKAIEALEKQQEAIDKMIDETNEYFDKLIEALEDYKDRWQELAELEDQAKIMGILEELGYSTDDILNMSEDAFQAFKGEYLGILKDMNSGNDEFLNQLGKLAEVDLSSIPGYLESTADAINGMNTEGLDGLKQGFNDVEDSVNAVSSAIGGGGGGSATPKDEVSGGVEVQGSSGSGEGLVKDIENVNTADLSQVTNSFGAEEGSLLSAVNSVTEAIGTEGGEPGISLVPTIIDMPNQTEEPMHELWEQFSELRQIISSCVQTVTTLANKISNLKMPSLTGDSSGGGGHSRVRGTAYANGNWSAKSKGVGGKALTGEQGYEIVVDGKTGKWRTVGNKGAEFVNIKPSDIIFSHKQSEDLLKRGKTTGRAFASGSLPDGFKPLSDTESSKYSLFDKVKDISHKLELSNVALKSIDKTVETINNNRTTVNNSPTINIGDVQFTCTGVTGEQVLSQIQAQFSGIISRAYQESMAQ